MMFDVLISSSLLISLPAINVQVYSRLLIAGNSSSNIDSGGYSTREEFLRAQEYQSSSENIESEDLSVPKNSPPIFVVPQPSTSLKLGTPYPLDSRIVCREQNNGLQLFCLPKEQADKVWNSF